MLDRVTRLRKPPGSLDAWGAYQRGLWHLSKASAEENVIQSERYDRLLETNRAFRQARMRKECGPITDPQVHQQCLASFSQDEPMVASAASHRRVASSRHHAKQYVGSSVGPRHYQSHLGK
jgi:hypothetical protein